MKSIDGARFVSEVSFSHTGKTERSHSIRFDGFIHSFFDRSIRLTVLPSCDSTDPTKILSVFNSSGSTDIHHARTIERSGTFDRSTNPKISYEGTIDRSRGVATQLLSLQFLSWNQSEHNETRSRKAKLEKPVYLVVVSMPFLSWLESEAILQNHDTRRGSVEGLG
jgi:hypothetical protein